MTEPKVKDLVHINSVDDFNKLVEENNDSLIIIDLWADWCGPCRRFAPTFEEVQKKRNHEAIFAKLDVQSSAGAIANNFGVRGIPTMLFLHNKKEVQRMVGARSKAEFNQFIDEALEKIN